MNTKTSVALKGLGPRALRDPKMRALTPIKSLREGSGEGLTSGFLRPEKDLDEFFYFFL